MPPSREKRRSYASCPVVDGRLAPPVALDARDVPAAWRRAAREARGASFALYDPDGRRVRVGVAPPPALGMPLPATAVALTADGAAVVTGHDDGSLRVYDAHAGTLRWERFVGSSRIDCVIAPRRAPWLLACARSGEVWLLGSERGDVLLHLVDDEARALALTPDDKTLALAGSVVELWSLPDGRRLGALDLEPPADDAGDATAAGRSNDTDDGIHAIGFAADGQILVGARGHHGTELIVWDRASGRQSATRAEFPVDRLAIARRAARAVIGSREAGATVRVLDLATLQARTVFATGAEGLSDVRLTHDDRYALVHDDETGIHVVDVATGATRARLDEFEACAYVLRERGARRRGRGSDAPGAGRDDAADGGAEFGGEDTRVIALPRWRRGDPGTLLSGDGRRYAALRNEAGDGVVAIFDLTTCVPYAALSHARPIESAWLNHDGTRAVTRDSRGRVYVWSVPDAPDRLL